MQWRHIEGNSHMYLIIQRGNYSSWEIDLVGNLPTPYEEGELCDTETKPFSSAHSCGCHCRLGL